VPAGLGRRLRRAPPLPPARRAPLLRAPPAPARLRSRGDEGGHGAPRPPRRPAAPPARPTLRDRPFRPATPTRRARGPYRRPAPGRHPGVGAGALTARSAVAQFRSTVAPAQLERAARASLEEFSTERP